jgi:uracil-DNA glycosylase family 4
VRYRQSVAREKRAAFREWDYWGRPVPGFGDPRARLLVVGLAPAAHGGNRTGRMFTGDRSGDFLYRSLHRAGFASQAESTSRDDGMVLTDCFITAAARCAPPDNKPTPQEFARCRPFMEREITALGRLRVVVPLGALAMHEFLRAWSGLGHDVPRPRPAFRHGTGFDLGPVQVVASYHPSQRNTQTGLLTAAMLDAVFAQARAMVDGRDSIVTPRRTAHAKNSHKSARGRVR